ncbi:MAG: EAL domain-containing protein, partial [Frankiales bacterium]
SELVSTVQRVLGETGLRPGHLLLELTESALIGEAAVNTLVELRGSGVRIAIDDFGTGYSSLSYLKDLPVDMLKIDRSFVRDIADSPDASALTLSIIHLAQIFGLRIVGEGVETGEQAAALHALGCHVGQGHHYARPTDIRSLMRTLNGVPAPRAAASGSGAARPAAPAAP